MTTRITIVHLRELTLCGMHVRIAKIGLVHTDIPHHTTKRQRTRRCAHAHTVVTSVRDGLYGLLVADATHETVDPEPARAPRDTLGRAAERVYNEKKREAAATLSVSRAGNRQLQAPQIRLRSPQTSMQASRNGFSFTVKQGSLRGCESVFNRPALHRRTAYAASTSLHARLSHHFRRCYPL